MDAAKTEGIMGTDVVTKIIKSSTELSVWKSKNTPERCPLCNRLMSSVPVSNRVVDHDHKTGAIRGVLCRNCNGLEGKLRNLCLRAGNHIEDIEWLERIIAYWKREPFDVYYPGTTFINGQYRPPIKRRRKKTWTK